MDLPGEKVLIRLIDLLETGIGGALRPWQVRRVEGANAEARIYERLLLEQAEKDIPDIRAGRKRIDASGKPIVLKTSPPLALERPKITGKGEIRAPLPIIEGFGEVARDAAHAQEMQRAVNLKRVALFAEEEAEELDERTGEPRTSDAPPSEVDADWFANEALRL